MITSFLVIALRYGFILFITIVIYRIISSNLSIAEFGIVNYILTIIEIGLLFAGFGVPELIRRKVAQDSSTINIGGYLGIYFKSIAIGSLLTAFFLMYLISNTATSIAILFFIISILMLFSGIKKILISMYESMERYSFLSVILSIESIAIVLILFYFSQKQLSITNILIAYLLPSLLISVVLWKGTRIPIGNMNLKQLVIEGRDLFALGISIFLYHKIDIFILEMLSSRHELGLYAGMYRIFETTYILPSVVTFIIYPRLFGDRNRIYLFRKGLLVNMMLSLVCIFCTILFSPFLINLILTNKFSEGRYILHVLMLGMLLQSISMILGRGIIALEREALLLKIAISGIVINVFLNIYLIPIYGGLGCAFATSASFSYSMLAQLSFYVVNKQQKYLNIKKPFFYFICFFCVLMLACIYIVYMLNGL